ncbi:unnamed protein product [marine sediment metagenome]|uniref:Uncharacterized protein n=1 Tax=marine sediment metagenome TaxID=412755 RepID=X1QZ09_9ZZZZ
MRNYAEMYKQLMESATLIGLDGVPSKHGQKGLYTALKRLSRRLEPGLAIRLLVPKEVLPSSIRTHWANICKRQSKSYISHVIFAENSDFTYVAYLWRTKENQ